MRARIGDSRCHQYSEPARRKLMCSSTCTSGWRDGEVVGRGDVPGPDHARRTGTPRRRGARAARRGARGRRPTRVTGRRITFVRPRIARIGTMSSSSMCWIMCMKNSWSASESSGEISATSDDQDRRHEAAQPPDRRLGGAPRRGGRGAPASQRLHVDAADDRRADQDTRARASRRGSGSSAGDSPTPGVAAGRCAAIRRVPGVRMPCVAVHLHPPNGRSIVRKAN